MITIKNVVVQYNKDLYDMAMIKRWHIYKDRPVKDISELCYLLRKIVNSDVSRAEAIKSLFTVHPRLIVFYNFDYEREMLLHLGEELNVPTAQWNGHKHEPIPYTKQWLYIVQYTAGAEGWNCIETNAIVFWSQNYSYKATVQAAGRIDRLNTLFTDLFYYHLASKAPIDLAIQRAFKNKQKFNEKLFINY